MQKNDLFKTGLTFAIMALIITATAATSLSSKQEFSQSSEKIMTAAIFQSNFNIFQRENPFIFNSQDIVNMHTNLIFDTGAHIQHTKDGGSIIAGQVLLNNPEKMYASLVKFDLNGTQQWSRLFKGLDQALGMCVKQTDDDGFILIGSTGQQNEKTQILLIKTDEHGNKQWQNTFSLMDGCIGTSVSQTSDKGFILTGAVYNATTQTEFSLILKTNQTGYLEKYTVFLEEQHSRGFSVHETDDAGYILVSWHVIFGLPPDVENYFYHVKFNSTLDIMWANLFSGLGISYSLSTYQTLDGGYIIAGQTFENFEGFYRSAWIIKTDAYGSVEWEKTYAGEKDVVAFDIKQIHDQGYIVIGQTGDFTNGTASVMLLKIDDIGNEIWNASFDLNSDISAGTSIDISLDNGFIITGFFINPPHHLHRAMIIKTDSSGSKEWVRVFEYEYNSIPTDPSIHGPSLGIVTNEYEFSFVSFDEDNDEISYLIDWGDDQTTDWTDFYSSGEQLTISHSWQEKGKYIIRAKVKDSNGAQSDWTFFEINIIEPNLGFLFGKIEKVSHTAEFTSCNAIRVIQIQVFPFSIKIFSDHEKIIISNSEIGFITENRILGLFRFAVL